MGPTSANQQSDDIWLNEYQDRLPPTLNVLTILTVIWSAFSFLTYLLTFAWAPIGYRNATYNQDALDQMPPLLKSLMGNTQEAARLAYVNRLPIMLVGLGSAFLCLFGAIRMRKRKKAGFVLYLLGDLLPLVNLLFFTVMSTLAGLSAGIGYGITILFLILYATQLKYMK